VRLSGWPKTTVLRLLGALEALEAVERDPMDKRYRALLRLVPVSQADGDPLEGLRPALSALASELGHTVELFRWQNGGHLMIDRCQPDAAPIAVRARVGRRRDGSEADSLNQLAAALADDPPQPHWLWQGGVRADLSAADWSAALAQASCTGSASDIDVNSHGIKRVAIAIRDGQGHYVGACAIARFPAYLDGADEAACLTALHQLVSVSEG
jgi:DNA-binding IclR family transcriptional regulator